MVSEFDFTRGWPFEPSPKARGISSQELRAREAALATAPLFSGLTKRQLRSLARVTGVDRFEAGRTIVKEGSRDRSFFVILEGRVTVTKGSRTVARLEAGQFFGEIALLDGDPRSASVIADSPTVCLDLAGGDFVDLLSGQPTIAITLLREVARRLRSAEAPVAG
jgi:CRP/FNR family transcriptional regulator, cyclic AMP receptor protein